MKKFLYVLILIIYSWHAIETSFFLHRSDPQKNPAVGLPKAYEQVLGRAGGEKRELARRRLPVAGRYVIYRGILIFRYNIYPHTWRTYPVDGAFGFRWQKTHAGSGTKIGTSLAGISKPLG